MMGIMQTDSFRDGWKPAGFRSQKEGGQRPPSRYRLTGAQVRLPGPQPPAEFASVLQAAKEESILRVRFLPHCGHGFSSRAALIVCSSVNRAPQSGQIYS